jgi:lipopolysaccharide biosynthesis protein/SAM-dependent methyltransferase
MNKNCTVDIVELDAASGSEAAKYAKNALLGEERGDIERYIWLSEFGEEKYDYIVFADVLEHLYHPEVVLNESKKLLKRNGSILLSVPNIAHNSIVLNLLNNKFSYTEYGLLDNTHIRFFTIESLKKIFLKMEMKPVYLDAVFVPVGSNEIESSYDTFSEFNMDVLYKHDLGEAYQFIVELKHGEVSEACDNRLDVSLKLAKVEYAEKISSLEKQVIEKKKKISVLENELVQKNNLIEAMQQTLSWRVTKPLRKLSSGRYTGIAYKGIKILKNDGLFVMLKKVKNKLYRLPDNEEEICKSGYWSAYQDEELFSGRPEVKALAFYLPQFHCFPENDEWWGEGFTEWTNTKKAIPLFEGHYQPREPHDDIGYYNLTDVEAIRKQAELAKKHGIYGFCIYYYWFSGKRLMEKPLDLLIEHPEIDINFCLCWANENWTRRWDGLDQEILIAQKYTKEDAVKFIDDLKKYIQDKRYIRVNGNPVIIVYNPAAIPNVKEVFKGWKKEAMAIGIGEISIWICRSFENNIAVLGLEDLVEKEIEFPPHNMPGAGTGETIPNIEGNIFNYSKLVNNILEKKNHEIANKGLYRTAMLGWDNSARRKSGYAAFNRFDLKKYYDWLKANVEEAKCLYDSEERFVFINAWNEWAEGTYLEPDVRYGYANINTTAKAIFNQPFGVTKICWRDKNKKPRIAVQAHIFFENLADEFMDYLNHMPEEFDCYITTDSMSKADTIFSIFKERCNANRIELLVVDNRGRDVAPFLLQMQGKIAEYEYLCHIHTKKSRHSDFGDKWRRYLLRNLIGSKKQIERIIDLFKDNNQLGIIYPEPIPQIRGWQIWSINKDICQALVERLGVNIDLDMPLEFPSGDMFWCRTEAVRQLFDQEFTIVDFPEERGQIDGTIMHAIERLWCYLSAYNGYENKIIKDDI